MLRALRTRSATRVSANLAGSTVDSSANRQCAISRLFAPPVLLPRDDRPETWVTDRTEHIGYTFRPFGEERWDAVEGVFGHGRKAAVCRSPASRRPDGGTLQGVWDFPQNRL